jgi:hypothetical protein
MRKILICLAFTFVWTASAHAGGKGGTGTIVYEDGSMVTIMRSRRHINRSYITRFDKDGNLQGGGCERESMSAFQARKAYMKAKAKWRAGYIPRRHSCL